MSLSDLLTVTDPVELHRRLGELLRGDQREPAEDKYMDTIGSLVDKLVTANMKMWFNQEQLFAIRRMSVEQFVERYGGAIEEVHALVRRCCDLNMQRVSLVDEIDRLFADVTGGRKVAETRPQHKTY